jgi:hypothetical protein
MSRPQKSPAYRKIIDELVQVCRDGQGQIGARRVRPGVWNVNATQDFIPDQHAINLLLKRLTTEDREIIAGMLAQAVVTGAFETLKGLEKFEVEPFRDGYEGSPYDDFIEVSSFKFFTKAVPEFLPTSAIRPIALRRPELP